MKTTLQTLKKQLLTFAIIIAACTAANAQCATSSIITNQGNGTIDLLNQSTYPFFYNSYIAVDFGDGSYYTGSGTSFTTSHTYTNNGMYIIQTSLYAYDPNDSINSCSIGDIDTVVISGLVPTCNLQANVSAYDSGNLTAGIFGYANNNYTSSYITVDGQIFWNTDSLSYTFSNAGTYSVCYYVEDSTFASYCYDSICTVVTVGNPPVVACNASFYIFPDSLNPNVWYGYNNSTSGNPASTVYSWDFGDGTTSTQAYPTHQYAVPGNYVICLTITDFADSCTSTYCDSSAAFRLSTNAIIGSISIAAPTGIKENITSLNEVKLYPNPIADFSSVSFNSFISSKGKIEVVSVLGAILISEDISIAKGANAFELNTSALANGVYYINVVSENRILSTVKAVK